MPLAEDAIYELIAYATARSAVFSIVVLRCSLVIGMSPWPGRSVPGAVRLILGIVCAGLICMALPDSASLGLTSGGAQVGAVIAEVFYSLALIGGLWFSVGALALCGQIAGMQMGFGLRGTMDPNLGGAANAVARIAVMAWLPFALDLGLHHHLVRLLAVAPAALDASASTPMIETASVIAKVSLRGSSEMFGVGLVGAGPVLAMSMLSHAGLGAITRAVPNAMIICEALGGAAMLGMIAVGICAGSWGEIAQTGLAPILAGVLDV